MSSKDWRAFAKTNGIRLAKGTSSLVVFTLLAFLGAWLFGKYNDRREAHRTEYEAKMKEAKDSVEFYRNATRRDSIEYRDRLVPQYIKVRDAAVADPKTPESTKTAFKACDLVLSACDSAQAKLRGQIRALEAQKDLLEHRPGPPRVVAFGEILYGITHSEGTTGLAPVIRVGITAKVLGPLSLSAAGQLGMPTAGHSAVSSQALAGVRVTF